MRGIFLCAGNLCTPLLEDISETNTAVWAGMLGSQEESETEGARSGNSHAPVYELKGGGVSGGIWDKIRPLTTVVRPYDTIR